MPNPTSSPTSLPTTPPSAPPPPKPADMNDWPALLICGHFSASEAVRDKYAAEVSTTSQNALKGAIRALSETGTLPPEPEDRSDIAKRWAYDAADTVRQMVSLMDGLAYRVIKTDVVCDSPKAHGTVDVLWCDRFSRRVTLCEYVTFYQPGRDYTAKLAGCAVNFRSTLNWTPLSYRLVTLCGEQHTASEVTMNYGECHDYYERALAVQAARERGGTLTLCQSDWCPLCAHAEGCPAYRKIAEAVLADTALGNAPTDWPTLATERKAQVMVLADTVTKWADAVKKAAKADLLNGLPIRDDANAILYILRTDRGRRIPRCQDARSALLSNGVPLPDLDRACTIPATAIKSLLSTRGIRGKAAEQIISDVSDIGPDVVKMVRG